jgi:hypothetical protein
VQPQACLCRRQGQQQGQDNAKGSGQVHEEAEPKA